MVDENFLTIKNRMLLRSMELWDIKDKKNIDPLFDLILHVFAYEITKLYQHVDISDNHLLDGLSRILVGNNRVLPTPAHALMNIQPEDDMVNLKVSDHFYCSKIRFNSEDLDLYFTSLFEKKLINASITSIAYGNRIYYNDEDDAECFMSLKEPIKDFEVWLGIDISDELLTKTEELSMCLIPNNEKLVEFFKVMCFYDVNGGEMSFNQDNHSTDNEQDHYFKDIMAFYEDYFYTVKLNQKSKIKKNLYELFSIDENIEIENKNVLLDKLWIKIKLPEIFTLQNLKSIDVSLNTFPVVNRKLQQHQHNHIKNGTILSIFNKEDYHFLNINSLIDDRGNVFFDAIKKTTQNSEGCFTLYFGDIGRFDKRSAKTMLSITTQKLKEEGSAFSSLSNSSIQGDLDDLYDTLNELDRKIKLQFKDFKLSFEKTFILTYPYDNTINYEFEYWLTSANLANGIKPGCDFYQYKMGKFSENKISLKTETLGGYVKKGELDKINSLRYGLLTRDRIVTKKDVKSFIKTKIGSYTKCIKITDGVAIDIDKKRGLKRITEVYITLNKGVLDEHKQDIYSHYLQKELEKKSITNISYKVIFI